MTASTNFNFTIRPAAHGVNAEVTMSTEIPEHERNMKDELTAILTAVGKMADDHDPIRGLMFLVGQTLGYYTDIITTSNTHEVHGASGLEAYRYCLVDWVEMPNEDGEPGGVVDPGAVGNSTTTNTSVALLNGIVTQLAKVESKKEREEIIMQLHNALTID